MVGECIGVCVRMGECQRRGAHALLLLLMLGLGLGGEVCGGPRCVVRRRERRPRAVLLLSTRQVTCAEVCCAEVPHRREACRAHVRRGVVRVWVEGAMRRHAAEGSEMILLLLLVCLLRQAAVRVQGHVHRMVSGGQLLRGHRHAGHAARRAVPAHHLHRGIELAQKGSSRSVSSALWRDETGSLEVPSILDGSMQRRRSGQ